MSKFGMRSLVRGKSAPVIAESALGTIESLEPRMMLAYSTTVDLQFNAATGGINGTGFAATLPTTRGKGLIPANVTMGNGQLRLTSTAGDLTNNNQDDALNVPINGAADFQVETRLTSFGFKKNYQYAGILLGTNEDNYLNLITGYVGQPVIEFAAENNKAFTIPLWKAINPAGIVSVDLRVTGTAATKQVKAEYRINSDLTTGWVPLGSVAAPQVFNASAKAGVVATNVGSTTAVQTSFNWFTARHSPVVVPPPPPPPPPPPGKIPVTIGTNLEGIADYSTISPFIDLSTMFRQWGSMATPYIADPSIPMTADNYPLADAGTMSYARTYPDGDYQVSYAGQANLSFSGLNANFQVTSSVNGITKGVLHLEPISHPGNVFMYAKGLNPANPLRDLHIISPDANLAISDTFRPVFLQKLAPFDGYLRVMDWMRTMSSPIVNWADRTKTSRFSYVTETGVPYEVIIKLANTAKKDLYINIPVQATDDYVHELAKMFRDQLAPDRKLYVEFANELWGYIGNLPDANLSLAAAQQERLTDKTLWKTDAWGLSAQRVGKKLGNAANIFKQEWGATRYASQIRFQMGALIAASSWGDIALQYIQDNFGPVKNLLSGLSVGNYVGVWTDFDVVDNSTLTLDRLFDWTKNFINTQMSYWLKTNKAVADKYGLQLNIYEGGQAFTFMDGRNESIKRAAQNDPRMGDMYRQLITQFTQISGGGIWGNYALSSAVDKFGFWGVLENITDAGSVKYNTITAMVNATV